MQLFDSTDKNALITGRTRGIGFVIAQGVKQADDGVQIHGSSEDRTRRIAEENGFDCLYGGFRNQEGLDGILCPFPSRENRLDVLADSAGFRTCSAIENVEEESMDAIYDVNTKSPHLLLQKLSPVLKKAGRISVISVTPIYQKIPVRENDYYRIAKVSLSMFTKVAALELAKYGIRASNLVPGATLTGMNREPIEAMDLERWIPIGRVGHADEPIGPAVLLTSDASSYVTETTLYVDGGHGEDLLWYQRLGSGITEWGYILALLSAQKGE